MSGTSTIRSEPIKNISLGGVAVQVKWTGTPTGTWKWKVSNNYIPETETSPGDPTSAVGVTWTELTYTFAASVTPAGSASDAFLELETKASWVMLEYTNASGSGTLSAWASGHGA